MNMPYEIVIILAYTGVGKYFSLLLGNRLFFFFFNIDYVFVWQNMEHFDAYDYFCIFKLFVMENYCIATTATLVY